MGVCKKKRVANEQECTEEIGRKWIWTALETTSRLIVCFTIGDRTLEDARQFLRNLASRSDDMPLFTSDELPHYADGLMELFNSLIQPEPTGRRGRPRNARKVVDERLDYATVDKTRNRGRIVNVETRIVYGCAERIDERIKELPGQQINTSYVERSNLNRRMWDAHLSRKSLMFAKSFRWLKAKFSICIGFYNFIRPHGTLSKKKSGRFCPMTPAMAAGITDHPWTIDELLNCKIAVN